MASRHLAREMAVQLNYQFSLTGLEENSDASIESYWKERSSDNSENKEFYSSLVRGTLNHLPEIDAHIEKTLENWKFSRVDKVDLAILRTATYELLFFEAAESTDTAVILNEAVEISKKYGTKDSSVFINGVLDRIAQLRNNKDK